MLGGYIFLCQVVSVGNYWGMVSSREKILYVGPSMQCVNYPCVIGGELIGDTANFNFRIISKTATFMLKVNNLNLKRSTSGDNLLCQQMVNRYLYVDLNS